MVDLSFEWILFLNSFLGGLTVPVISLVFLDKGLNFSELSFFLGIYSFVIIFAEVPTGILADMMGRKKIFSVSLIGNILSSICLIAGGGKVFLFLGIMSAGLSRAFASGSLDALYVDYRILQNKDEKEKISASVMTRISILETLGLATGSALGGFLPLVSKKYFSFLGDYDMNLILKIGMSGLVLLLTTIWIREISYHEEREKSSLRNRVKEGMSLIKGDPILSLLFLSVFLTGFFLFSLEAYW